jgi:hypothetical protein
MMPWWKRVVPMNVCHKLSGESECRQRFLEAISSVEVLEAPKLEIGALATLPTLFVWEDVKQKCIRKSLQAYSSFIF